MWVCVQKVENANAVILLLALPGFSGINFTLSMSPAPCLSQQIVGTQRMRSASSITPYPAEHQVFILYKPMEFGGITYVAWEQRSQICRWFVAYSTIYPTHETILFSNASHFPCQLWKLPRLTNCFAGSRYFTAMFLVHTTVAFLNAASSKSLLPRWYIQRDGIS